MVDTKPFCEHIYVTFVRQAGARSQSFPCPDVRLRLPPSLSSTAHGSHSFDTLRPGGHTAPHLTTPLHVTSQRSIFPSAMQPPTARQTTATQCTYRLQQPLRVSL